MNIRKTHSIGRVPKVKYHIERKTWIGWIKIETYNNRKTRDMVFDTLLNEHKERLLRQSNEKPVMKPNVVGVAVLILLVEALLFWIFFM